MTRNITTTLLLTLMGGLFCSSASQASVYSAQVLSDPSLVAYYRLNETSGTTAVNEQGNISLDGTYTNSPVQTNPGPRTPDFVGFDSTNTAVTSGGGAGDVGVSIDGAALGSLPSWSIEAWARPTDVLGNNAPGQGQNIFVRQAGGFNDDVFLGIHPEGSNLSTLGRWALIQRDDGTSTRATLTDSVDAVNDQWYYIVATYDAAPGTLTLYVDGESVGSTTNAATARGLSALGADAYIARWSGAFNRNFIGDVDEVAIYNSALSASDVLSNFQAASIPEPSSLFLLGLGAVGLFSGVRRRTRR